MISQTKDKRVRNFDEVALGFSKKQAVAKARSFPQPTHREENPHCPLGIDISEFIRILREGDIPGALEKIKEENEFPSICGRVCPAPCEKDFLAIKGRKPFGIRALERFVSDQAKQRTFAKKPARPTGKKVAIVGSGPSGLYAAVELAKRNYRVTIYEACPEPGGSLRYGTPSFRLPEKVLNEKIKEIKLLGVEMITSMPIGRMITLNEIISEGNEAVLLAIGRGCPELIEIEGSELKGIYYAHEFCHHIQTLTPRPGRAQLSFHLGKRVTVIGSNARALDCARIAVRLGLDVTMICQETEHDLDVCAQDKDYTQEEGVTFETSVRPVEFIGDEAGDVRGVRCVELDYADPDSTGKWELHPVPGTEYTVDTDSVIISAARQENKTLRYISDQLQADKGGSLIVDEETGMTSCENVFATGSLLSDKSDVIDSFLSGKFSAEKIHEHLSQKGI